MHRKIFFFCVTVILILSFVTTAFAESFDPENTGSISITLEEQYEKTPLAGAELSLYYVATIGVKSNGNLSYSYTEPFNESGIALDEADIANKLSSFISKNNVEATKIITDEKGNATVKSLPLGLYIICQTGNVEGYAPIEPFLVTVPFKTAEGYEYDVDATPKTEVARLTSITIKKIWNTDAATKAADSVTVQLLYKGNVIKTVKLSEENNWTQIYTDMPESDAYSIKEVKIPEGFTATYKQDGYVFTVINSPKLIQTGQLIWPVPVLAFAGMILLSVGISALKKKRKPDA